MSVFARPRSLLASSLVVVALAGCTASERGGSETQQSRPSVGTGTGGTIAGSGAKTWDVNDVSVLYPLRRFGSAPVSGARGLPYLSDGLLSEVQFRSILGAYKTHFAQDFSSGAQSAVMNSLDKWAVVGFRIQSCGRVKASDPCTQVVNLIAQPAVSNERTTGDFAMHLTYKTTRSSSELLDLMIKLRDANAKDPKATLGKPLGVHPILAKEGLDSKFSQALRNDFLKANLSSQRLISVAASFVEPNRLQPWVFAFFSARDFSKPVSHSIFMFDPGTSVNDCGVQRGRLICRRDPSGRVVDSLQKQQANPNGTKPTGLTPAGEPYLDDFLTLVQTDRDPRSFPTVNADAAKWRDVFNRLENPNLVAPEQSNCSSCHRTHTERSRLRGMVDLSPTGERAFRIANGTGCTTGIASEIASRGVKTINIRMFGYLHSEPVVTKRVENETLQVCEALKRTRR